MNKCWNCGCDAPGGQQGCADCAVFIVWVYHEGDGSPELYVITKTKLQAEIFARDAEMDFKKEGFIRAEVEERTFCCLGGL